MAMVREFANRGLRARKEIKREGKWLSITLEGDVEVMMDIEKLGEILGKKAIRNTSKRATAMRGLIVAKARNVQEVG